MVVMELVLTSHLTIQISKSLTSKIDFSTLYAKETSMFDRQMKPWQRHA